MDKEKANSALLLASTTLLDSQSTQMVSWVSNPYLAEATSANTRKAYRSDIRQFEQWGGRLPATPESIVMYLQAVATHLNSRTLSRRLVALKHWHTYQGFADPTAHPIVSKTMIGITRAHGKPKQKAPPLMPEILQQISAWLTQNPSLSAIRDNAILQLGFFAALRRSELVNIHYEHIKWEDAGIELLLPSSKTDQTHQGQFCAIPYGNSSLCPVSALENWLNHSQIKEGPIFRSIRNNKVISSSSLTPLSINHILQKRAKSAGIPNAQQLSAHSLRRGLATSAARADTALHVIMRAGRWKQVNTVMEYIEASERFSENAAVNILRNLNEK